MQERPEKTRPQQATDRQHARTERTKTYAKGKLPDKVTFTDSLGTGGYESGRKTDE